jgi:dTMP kinase
MTILSDHTHPLGITHTKQSFSSSSNEQTMIDILSKIHYQEAHRAKSQMLGKFIVFEGLDGAGTSTQAQALVNHLQAQNINAYLTFEPTNSSIGHFIRQALQDKCTGYNQRPLPATALALLFAADRADHWYNDIQPRLAEGSYVICDRYLYSSLAYQGLEHPQDWVSLINAYYPQPDLLFYLHVDADVAAHRRNLRQEVEDLYEKNDLQVKIAQAYNRLFQEIEHQWIDGTQSIEKIHSECLNIVQFHLLSQNDFSTGSSTGLKS